MKFAVQLMRSALAAIGLALLLAPLASCSVSRADSAKGPDCWWTSYGGGFANTRHLDLDDIGPSNVGSLRLMWKFSTGIAGQIETSPVVVGGRMYFTTGPDNGVYALNAANGALIWHFMPQRGAARYVFNVNRGVAIDAGRVFLTTLDDRLIALDAGSGKVIFDRRIGDPRTGLSEDAAPLAWNGLVFVGSAGNEFGVRGSFSAFSQRDGKLVWRWWAVSPGWEGTFAASVHGVSLHRGIARERAQAPRYRDAWKTGGGAVWLTPALGTHESTIYLSTGNPAPAFNGARRPGDNLYTECIVALDARSGKMKWYYQETPHDVWDYDASSPPILVDALDATGRRVPAVAEAGKTGWLYVVERSTGHLLRISQPFVPQPHMYAAVTTQETPVQPGDMGGAIGPIAADPGAHTAFVAGNVAAETAATSEYPAWRADSQSQWEGGMMAESAGHATSLLSSIDLDTGRIRWSSFVPNVIYGGPLSINGLVFLGETATGEFKAYAAATGEVLWHVVPGETPLARFDARDRTLHLVRLTTELATRAWHRVRHVTDYGTEDNHAPPVAYRMNGREYIAVANDVFERMLARGGDTVYAFGLP